MYPQNIYEKTIEDNCKLISIEQFKPILAEVKTHKLQSLESYILQEHFVKGRTVNQIKYDLGYKNTSQIYNKIRKIVSVLREMINFRYCDSNDYLSLFIGKDVVKKARIKDCTIAEAIEMYSNKDYIYHNYYDEVISYTVLKRFSYPANLLHMYYLRYKEYRIALYFILYKEDGEPKIFGDKTFQYLFVKNIDRALGLICNSDPIYINGAISSIILNPITGTLQPLVNKLRTNHFTKLICDPECLYTDKYFDYKLTKNITLDYLSLTMSQSLYDICVNRLHISTLFGLMYSVYSMDSNISPEEMHVLNNLINSICIVNKDVRESKEYIQNFIKEAKEYI